MSESAAALAVASPVGESAPAAAAGVEPPSRRAGEPATTRPVPRPDEPGPSGSSGPAPAGHRRGTLAVAALVVVLLVAAVLLLVRLRGARLQLSHDEVPIGTSYLATASGFEPGEPVRFSWTGPTRGVMMPAAADAQGRSVEGPILERDPPGRYTIVATGLRSGRTAQADLQVLPGRMPAP